MHKQTAAILVRKWIVRMDGETSETRSLLSVLEVADIARGSEVCTEMTEKNKTQ